MRRFLQFKKNRLAIRLGVGYLLLVFLVIALAGVLLSERVLNGWVILALTLIVFWVVYELAIKSISILTGDVTRLSEVLPGIEQKLSENKRAEADLYQVQEHLEDLVRDRTVELTALTEIGKALSSTLGVKDLLQLIYEQTQ